MPIAASRVLRCPLMRLRRVSTQGRGDEAALAAALAADIDYIAFVGSRKKAGALKAALAKRGVAAEQLAKLKAPAGLDLGAITPEEIAISVVAEIVAVRRGKLRSDPWGECQQVGGYNWRLVKSMQS